MTWQTIKILMFETDYRILLPVLAEMPLWQIRIAIFLCFLMSLIAFIALALFIAAMTNIKFYIKRRKEICKETLEKNEI